MSNSTKTYRINLFTSKIFKAIIEGFVRLGEFVVLIACILNMYIDDALIKIIAKMRKTIINIPPIVMHGLATFFSHIGFLLIPIKLRVSAISLAIEKYEINIIGKLEIYFSYVLKLLFRVLIPLKLIGAAEFEAQNYRRVFGWDRNLNEDPPTDYHIGDWDSPTIKIRDLDIAG